LTSQLFQNISTRDSATFSGTFQFIVLSPYESGCNYL
jgi:hypothetical protein